VGVVWARFCDDAAKQIKEMMINRLKARMPSV